MEGTARSRLAVRFPEYRRAALFPRGDPRPGFGDRALPAGVRAVAFGGLTRGTTEEDAQGPWRESVSATDDVPCWPLLSLQYLDSRAIWNFATDLRAPVSALAFTPDGLLIAGGGDSSRGGGEVALWDPRTMTPRWVQRGADRSTIAAVAAVSTRAVLAACAWDNVLREYDAETGALQRTLAGHTEGAHHMVTALAVTPGGERAASAGHDGLVKVWDLATGAAVQTIRAHDRHVGGLALEGTWLATASADGTARLWDVASGRCVHTLAGQGAPVWMVALAADGGRVAASGHGQTLDLWSTADGARLAEVALGSTPVALQFAGDEVVVVTSEGSVLAWDGRLRDLGTDTFRG